MKVVCEPSDRDDADRLYTVLRYRGIPSWITRAADDRGGARLCVWVREEDNEHAAAVVQGDRLQTGNDLPASPGAMRLDS